VNDSLTIIKRNLSGEETWRYPGRLLIHEGSRLVLEARFNRPDLLFMGVVWRSGDRFVETYFTDRWYNIYEIHDRDDDALKGWYCNISRPAVLEAEDRLSYVDLALDLWIAADGTQTVLDEDEFAALALEEVDRARARQALEELQAHFARK
jgi:predicted RNA-binding protein associated with RNAse of E/G family